MRNRRPTPGRFGLGLALFSLLGIATASPLFSQQVPGQQRTRQLPDAPVPANRPNNPAAVEKRHWSPVVEPGEQIPTLTVRDKLLFPLHEEVRPLALAPVLISAEYGVLSDSDPKVGTNGTAFGKRVGDAALRQASIRILSDGLLPVVFREDPRYFRLAYGNVGKRAGYSILRLFIDPRDSGIRGFDFSDTLGRGMAAALTQAYYPDRSVHAEVVFRVWITAMAGAAGGNLFEEFWPDIKLKVFKRQDP